MPIYEYRCDRCGNEFEQLVLKTSPAPECPACQGQNLTRLLSLSRVTSESMRTRAFHEADRRAQHKRQEQERVEHDDHTH